MLDSEEEDTSDMPICPFNMPDGKGCTASVETETDSLDAIEFDDMFEATEEEVERLCDAAALALGRGEVPGCLGAID